MRDGFFILAILSVQAVCAVFFVSDIALTVLGLRSQPLSWQTREFLEIGAAVGLILGLVLGGLALRRTMQKAARAKAQLRVAAGAFAELMQERFDEWALTPAEREVALFCIKGLSTPEIAGLRNTSEGTVKAQTNAIYRKADVSGRPQLLGLFIEDLLAEDLVPASGFQSETQA
ncbi:LuxR family transcriptional regulator [Rhodovulum iodosum]|uniref:helix-turn-helix transcriptional regulator n=1 Tax=Rhodovulum iodosum TaxID=68291 RepID=UPI000F66E389|nr:helix-turn-helix transcriptional regulator [Rhodovulum robiginosum]RSK34134.1 LuxR family transcriptional regulator [Rhodovulum robiginosum]